MRKLYFYFVLFTMAFSYNLHAQQTERVYLSGTGPDKTVDWDFFCTEGNNSGNWTKIPVPSNWELQGFGKYDYGYSKEALRGKEKGLYKYTFRIPENWKGKIIQIVFEGSMTDTEVKINGKSAGEIHQGAFYRFKYDITELVDFNAENTLEVNVSKISSNEAVNKAERNADYWIFGGIYRPVYLEALPGEFIERVALNASSSGNFLADVYLKNIDKATDVEAEIFTIDGHLIQKVHKRIKKTDNYISLSTDLDSPLLWTPEFPNLYKVIFKLKSRSKVFHAVEEKFGFRTLELRKKEGVYLNGEKIKFKGVNRHSFRPETGRALSKKDILEDVLLIKDMNMNAVRNSHYPADEYFYEVCDSLGIMVFDELGGWHDAYDTPTGTKLVKEMMIKSMNHPCVVMWINGNEGGHNPELIPVYGSLDIQKRPVLQAWENFGGMDTQHYRDYNYGVGSHYQGHDVVMPTEFLHGMYDGGSGSGLEDFWELMWHNSLSAGGLLWDFADEAVVRTDRNGELDSDGNHGADGIIGPHHEKEGSYYTIKEVWAPIHFERREITEIFDGTFEVENRYHFTNLKQCKFEWKLIRFPVKGPDYTKKIVSGNTVSPNIKPGEKGILPLLLPKGWEQFDFLYVKAKDPYGKEIFTWSWPIVRPKEKANEFVSREGDSKVSFTEKDTLLIVKAGGITARFSKKTGLLAGVENLKGSISLTNGPVLCEGESSFKELVTSQSGDSVIVEALFNEKSIFKSYKWIIYPSGWMKLDVVYSPVVERHKMLGISFNYPENKVESIEWMGDGPYRVWKNRMKGNNLGVWKKKYNNTITGQSGYIYPEFKGYHSRMYWLKINTKEQPFMVVCPDEDVFFRMYTPETPKDPYNTAPEFPTGDISFMQGITPMGTKCLQTFRMGPMSAENIYYTFGGDRPLKMTLYFDFSAR